jgi:hypothetical protein
VLCMVGVVGMMVALPEFVRYDASRTDPSG